MPLTGALQADFSDFVNESKKATDALGQMENEAKKTGATLAKTGSAMDGMSSGKAASGLTQLTTGLRSVDGSMNALGVSIAKPVALIEELGQVSGKTYAQLGLLGSAGVALGVVVAGMELGKWIADVTNMDETAKNLQSRFLGWNDSADAAANKQAVLALALQRTGKVFTDVNDAMAANQQWVKDHAKEVATATHRQAEWEKEIRRHRAELPEMLAAIANHTASVKQLHEEYHISEAALTFYIAKTKDQTAAQKEATAAGAAHLKATQELTELRKGYGVQLMSINAETLKAVQADLALGAGQATVAAAYGLTAEQVKAANDQLETNLKITTGLGAEWASVGEKVKITADSIIADTNKMSEAAKAYQAETDRMAEGVQEIKPPIAEATKETQQLTYAMNQAAGAALSVHQQLQAGMAVMDAYREAGVATGMQTAMGGYNFSRIKAAGVMPTTSGEFGKALTVNVNSTEAQDIAAKLVTEMRHQGVRF